MQVKEYQAATLRTCVENRNICLTSEVATSLNENLTEAMRIGMNLDKLKKIIFYRKDTTLPEQLSSNSKQIDELNLSEEQFVTLHAVMGIVTEGAELISAMLKYIETGKLDKVNFGEELGDVSWYQGMWCGKNGVDLSDVLETNINKLKARYPEKFTDFLADNRDLEQELVILKQTHGLDEK